MEKQEIRNKSYNLEIDELYKELDSTPSGLNDDTVIKNRNTYGVNKLFEKKQKKWWQYFIEQYKDVLMIVLIFSSIISLLVSIIPQQDYGVGELLLTFEGWENFALIVIVTLINATLGTIQAIKSQKSLDGLKKLSSPKAKVIRNNIAQIIDTSDVVVGDIIILEAGDFIPADARLIETASFKVNESSLTGESDTIFKKVGIIKEQNASIGDRNNSIFSGCLVVYGRAKAIVTAVGSDTEIGKINTLLNETTNRLTPLQINLNKLAKFLMYFTIVICIVLMVVNLVKIPVIDDGKNRWITIFGDSLNFAVALAVAVIPEALGSIITIVLSISIKKLSKQKAIVKELKAVEGLGSVSVICSDKTGTLTQNKMTVKGLYTNHKDYSENDDIQYNSNFLSLPEMAVLCCDAKSNDGVVIGDPTEICLVEYFNKKDNSELLKTKYERIAELPFDSERMMMTTLIKNKGHNLIITKGAIDKLISRIDQILIDGKIRKITNDDLKKIQNINKIYAHQGKRVLAFAFRETTKKELSFDDENNLVFVGLMNMIDPPRPEVIKAVKECKIAGIRPIMITGDHKDTAVAIAQQIGIFNEQTDLAMTGKELKTISDQDLASNVSKYSVYARVSPEDKIKIVRAWQKQDMIVSMTGDGVNDAPALKEANIGVAMGITGTEVSKDAASIILTDDNFATIVSAVKSGRNIYNNIKNAIRYLLTNAFATILVSIVLTVIGLILKIEYVPFAAVQLLFLNLLTDSWPAISLGLESANSNVIYEKPRKTGEFFINKIFLKKMFIDSFIMMITVLASFFLSFYANNNLDIGIRYDQACAISFLTLSFARILYAFNCRGELLFSSQFYDNKFLLGSFVLVTLLIIFVSYTPGVDKIFLHSSTMLQKNPVTPSYQYYGIWISFGFAIFVLLFNQIYLFIKNSYTNHHDKTKLFFKKEFKNNQSYELALFLYKNQNITIEEIKNQFNNNLTFKCLQKLINRDIVSYKYENNQYIYFLNQTFKVYIDDKILNLI